MNYDNRAIALRFATEGWGTKLDWQAVWDELASPELVQHFCSFPDPIVGLAANKAFNADLFIGFPNLEQTIEQVVAEGDKVSFVATLAGTHTGHFLDIPPTGKVVTASESFNLLRLSEGKVVEWWYQLNLLSVMQQLGAA